MHPHQRSSVRTLVCALFAAVAAVPFASKAYASRSGNECRGTPAVCARVFQNAGVALAKGSPVPRYPDVLVRAGMSGMVAIEIVVDTSGVADTTSYKVLMSSQPLFGISVRTAIATMRFTAARRGGRKIAQAARIGFKFEADGHAPADSTRYPVEIVIKPPASVNK
jgi:TonB family protein